MIVAPLIKFSRLLWNSKIRFRVHKRPPPTAFLGLMTEAHTLLTKRLLYKQLNLKLNSELYQINFTKWSLAFRTEEVGGVGSEVCQSQVHIVKMKLHATLLWSSGRALLPETPSSEISLLIIIIVTCISK
jgi:hypothetical protein